MSEFQQQRDSLSKRGSFTRKGSLTCLVAAVAAASGASAQPSIDHTAHLLDKVSFETPLKAHDAKTGARVVPNFIPARDAVVKRNFLRLAPDEPGATGALWGQAPLNSDAFSLEMKYRISGAGEDPGGEALSLLIIDQLEPADAPFGLADGFTGVAVTIGRADGARHAVSLVVGDGSTGAAAARAAAPGCDVPLRYWEGRGDFSVLRASRLRLRRNGGADGSLVLEVDPHNTGLWRRCAIVAGAAAALPDGWERRAVVGLLARNGDGGGEGEGGGSGGDSNNHDVLALRVYDAPEAAWELDHYEGQREQKMDVLAHHLEHELFEVKSQLDQALTRLEHSKEASKARVSALEGRVMDFYGGTEADGRLDALEERMYTRAQAALTARLAGLQGMGTLAEMRTKEASADLSADQYTPFYALGALMATITAATYMKLRTLQTSKLL